MTTEDAIEALRVFIAPTNSDARLAVEEIDRLRADNDRLEAIVSKLPHTADGVPVVPGMKVYPRHPIEAKYLEKPPDHGILEYGVYDPATGEFHRHGTDEFRVGVNYSTPEAARSASSDKPSCPDCADPPGSTYIKFDPPEPCDFFD